MDENLKLLINDIYNLKERDWDNIDKSSNENLIREKVLSRPYEKNIQLLEKILKESEFTILCLRYGLLDSNRMTYAEIGKKYGYTSQRAQQIGAKAMQRLRHSTNQKILFYNDFNVNLLLMPRDLKRIKIAGVKSLDELIVRNIKSGVPIKEIPIEDLSFSLPTYKRLKFAKINNLFELASLSIGEMKYLKRLDPTSINEIIIKVKKILQSAKENQEEIER